MSDNSLAVQSERRIDAIKNTVMSPSVKERFSEMMGANAIYYLNQVMILVANSDDLQACTPKSILISAMRAASLRLSLDPSTGQAWLVPYKGVATFQVGYKGIYELAMRTNLYKFINMINIYQGEELIQDRMTGIHSIGGKRTGDQITHYMLYFELTNGFRKTFAMSIEEIEQHASKYSPGYSNPKSPWKDPNKHPIMQMKTVLANGLRKWGRFNDGDIQIISEIEENQDWQDRQAELPQAFSDLKISEDDEENQVNFYQPAAQAQSDEPKPHAMTIEEAESMWSESMKLTYGCVETQQLTYALNAMLKKPTEANEQKRTAIKLILDARSDGRPVQTAQKSLI